MKLPARVHVEQMKHKYKVGDKVRVTNHKYINGTEGEIVALMPYTFAAPAYYVRSGGMVAAVSERSLERVENMPSCGDV
jgi:hypothetical protein